MRLFTSATNMATPSSSSAISFGVAILLLPAMAFSNDESDQKSSGVAQKEEVTEEQAEFFRDKVFPLLESRCFECHGDQEDIEADLRLTSKKAMLTGGESGAAIVPSEPDQSLLIQAVKYENFQMPPRSKMPDEEIDILVKWIKDGAPWPSDMESGTAHSKKAEFPLQERIASHWAWKKIVRPDLPMVTHADWPASPIDHFVLAKLEDAKIVPAVDADRRALIRRMYFDLIGLPPTIEQQDRFFNDSAETSVAMEKVVDELLASPHFGERWARHWLDLMRYAETLGHEFDYPLPYAWRYRDYVIRALNEDVPYDQFVREHIAGDLMVNPRRNPMLGYNESLIATGFWYLCEDKHAPVDVKAEEASRIDNQIDVFGKTFLGLTISCARCHDHKFDAITADDYYALSGFLQSSRRRVEWLDSNNQTDLLVSSLQSAQLQTANALQIAAKEYNGDELTEQLTQAVAAVSSSDPPGDPVLSSLRAVLKDENTRKLSHPLSLLATLAQASSEISDAATIAQWVKLRDETLAIAKSLPQAQGTGWVETKIGSPTVVAADLRAGLPIGWNAFGAAFDAEPFNGAAKMAASWSPVSAAANVEGCVSSAVLSPALRGQLHSPEFVLTHPEIQILAAGKASRVRLVIDGYVMNEFSELLFGGCRQPIDTDGAFRWIRIAGDVKRYLGHRCHLEFLDEADGWFAVREIRLMGMSDEAPTTAQEVCRTNASLQIPDVASRDLLIPIVAAALREDPAWIAKAAEHKLFSIDSQKIVDAAQDHWRTLTNQTQLGDPVLVMCDGPGEDEYVFIRGNHNNHGPTAVRHMLTALDARQPLQHPSGSGRLELVDRLLDHSNPFPARVAVNRVWQHLLGRGLVPTSENFGVLGEAPSHPELLDLLADDFRNDGWSLKRLIKRIVMSRTYRLSSQRNPIAEPLDPGNRLLHRFSIRRLEGETLRDSILAISGRLDPQMFGGPVPVYLSGFMQGRGRPGNSGPLDGAGRRSIYQGVNRNFLNPFMLAFDTPQPATAIARRAASNVPAQALILMNSEFVHEQASVWAARLLNEVADGGDALIQRAFRQAFSRPASNEELESFKSFAAVTASDRNLQADLSLRDAAIITEICHVMMNQKEFLFLD